MGYPFVVGNWKMNTTIKEARILVQEISKEIADLEGIIKIICPPFMSLESAYEILESTTIELGAQNFHPALKGAFTGEISGVMLQDLCRYVIVGHSERRHAFGETNEFIGQKVLAALELGITPILCVGETFEQEQNGKTNEIIAGQIQSGFASVDYSNIGNIVVAYEPVWAIGTGQAASPERAQQTMSMIRREIGRLHQDDNYQAASTTLLYGGSVNATNIGDFAEQKDIDGALVGGASLFAKDFGMIANAIAISKKNH
jgi:triosephosphate isomerase